MGKRVQEVGGTQGGGGSEIRAECDELRYLLSPAL